MQTWRYRFFSPLGDLLDEGETPYWHGEHPYVLNYTLSIDGEVHAFVEDVIDQQRYINRLITMIDFIMGSSAKGVLLFPEDQIPDGMTIEDIADEWTKYNGIILFRPRPGSPMPQQIAAVYSCTFRQLSGAAYAAPRQAAYSFQKFPRRLQTQATALC